MASSRTADSQVHEYKLPHVIAASSAGTVVEWYDFYIFGSLFAILSTKFFPPGNEVLSTLGTLALFGVGFVVRPFGALFFGSIGDRVGRKYAFIITISIMGAATFLIGLVPTYASIGYLAPALVIVLRLAQGLALGGEYGGAAIYVAEHAPDHQRGYYTAYIQTTATLGLVLALAVVVGFTVWLGDAAMSDYGWRLPFLLSSLLVGLALYIRLKLRETPLFTRLKEAGNSSESPIKDAFAHNQWKLILLVLFGATAGQAVVWYTGQFYALVYMQDVLEIGTLGSSLMVGIALILATPFFLVFGKLSDTIGRKPIILTGCALAALTYIPIYTAMDAVSNPLNPVAMTALVFVQVIYVTMVYGPIAAYLVELFPAKVRYTSLSIPYHLGNGEFGGLTPFIIASIAAATGNNITGLVYPIGVATITVFVGIFFLKETKHVRIWDEVGGEGRPASAKRTAQA
ncbi:MFS transporter [soil metagenome]